MELSANQNVIVIAGAWNPAIFSKEWVENYLFDSQLVEGPPNFLNLPGNPKLIFEGMVFKLNGVGISCKQGMLTILVDSMDSDHFVKAEELAYKLVEFLPHTPVNAFGINFQFSEPNDQIPNNLSEINYNSKVFGNETNENNIHLTNDKYCFENGEINIATHISNKTKKVDINFHFPINNFIELKARLTPNKISELLPIANQIVNQ